MSKRTCQNCAFRDICSDNHPCKHYAPIKDDEGYDQTIIERGRKQFALEWMQYLAEAQPSDY